MAEPTRWLVGVATLNAPARTVRVVPVSDEEMMIAAQMMIDQGDEIVFAFTREVGVEELAPVLARGDSIMGTFGKDIETLFHTGASHG